MAEAVNVHICTFCMIDCVSVFHSTCRFLPMSRRNSLSINSDNFYCTVHKREVRSCESLPITSLTPAGSASMKACRSYTEISCLRGRFLQCFVLSVSVCLSLSIDVLCGFLTLKKVTDWVIASELSWWTVYYETSSNIRNTRHALNCYQPVHPRYKPFGCVFFSRRRCSFPWALSVCQRHRSTDNARQTACRRARFQTVWRMQTCSSFRLLRGKRHR